VALAIVAIANPLNTTSSEDIKTEIMIPRIAPDKTMTQPFSFFGKALVIIWITL
jgi:hypothetical protein